MITVPREVSVFSREPRVYFNLLSEVDYFNDDTFWHVGMPYMPPDGDCFLTMNLKGPQEEPGCLARASGRFWGEVKYLELFIKE